MLELIQLTMQSLMLMHPLNKEELGMKELYTTPEVELIEFDAKDVITTSGILDSFSGEAANTDAGWTGLY